MLSYVFSLSTPEETERRTLTAAEKYAVVDRWSSNGENITELARYSAIKSNTMQQWAVRRRLNGVWYTCAGQTRLLDAQSLSELAAWISERRGRYSEDDIKVRIKYQYDRSFRRKNHDLYQTNPSGQFLWCQHVVFAGMNGNTCRFYKKCMF